MGINLVQGKQIATASWAINALTASYLEGYISPFPYTGSAQITGSLEVIGPSNFYGLQTISSSIDLSALDIHVKDDILWTFRTYNDSYSSTSIGLASWIDNDGVSYLGTETERPLYLYNNAQYNSPTLILSSSGVTIGAGGITGSLFGTASYAISSSRAVTSSFAISSSRAISATTASYSTTLGATLSQASGNNTVSLVNSDGTSLGTATIDGVTNAGYASNAGTANDIATYAAATVEQINIGQLNNGTYAYIVRAQELEESKYATHNIYNNLNFI